MRFIVVDALRKEIWIDRLHSVSASVSFGRISVFGRGETKARKNREEDPKMGGFGVGETKSIRIREENILVANSNCNSSISWRERIGRRGGVEKKRKE